MATLLFWLFMLLLLAGVGIAGLWGYRAYATGDTSISWGNWFAPAPEPRLGVSEQANVDGRRKLLLIRRDDVEHLIMTGGPVDVVIETNIAAPKMDIATAEHTEHAEHVDHQLETVEPVESKPPPIFSRKPRSFGQAVNE